MSIRSTEEWRCPYCDALNDWQDEICQICGDGSRDEAVAAAEKKNTGSAADGGDSPLEEPKNNFRHTAEEPKSSSFRTSEYSGAFRTSSYTEKPKTETSGSAAGSSASGTSTSTTASVKAPSPKKQSRNWILIFLFFVIVAGGMIYMEGQRAEQEAAEDSANRAAVEAIAESMSATDPDALAEQIDLSLLMNIPGQASQSEVHGWLNQQGYTVEEMGEPNEYYFRVKHKEKETDWTISLPSSEYSAQQLRLSLPCAGYDMNGVYDSVSKRLSDNGWVKICEGGPGEYDMERLSVWKDTAGIFYYLWTRGEESNPEIWGEDLFGASIELAREEEHADKDKSQFASYDIQSEIYDFQSFVNMPFPDNTSPEQWVEKYGAGYPDGFEVSGYEENGVDTVTDLRKTYSNVANLEDILPYLINGFETAAGKRMRVSGGGGSYGYVLSTEDVSIYLSLLEDRSFSISVSPR